MGGTQQKLAVRRWCFALISVAGRAAAAARDEAARCLKGGNDAERLDGGKYASETWDTFLRPTSRSQNVQECFQVSSPARLQALPPSAMCTIEAHETSFCWQHSGHEHVACMHGQPTAEHQARSSAMTCFKALHKCCSCTQNQLLLVVPK
jgi:hypothetical protein